ncbi:MAG: tetratricopeptide repeat protein [Proteobacteria bacterium]|nr:tetratricopeptide repeat protein [Pseudomonadota bacterium]
MMRLFFLSLVILSYVVGTASRNRVWSNDVTLWNDCIEKNKAKARYKARPYRIYADSLKRENNFDNAIKFYREAMKFDPKSPLTYNNLGVILETQGSLTQAELLYRQALTIWPYYPDALNNLGNIFMKRGVLDQAIDYFTLAVKLKQDPDYCYNLGSAYQRKEQWDKAIIWIQEALKLKDDLEYAHNNLGVSYWRKGLYEQALAEFRRALEIKPDFFDAHANLGLLYYSGYKDNTQALFHLTRALTIAPAHPQAGMIKGVVEEIQRKGQRVAFSYQRDKKSGQRSAFSLTIEKDTV